ncbi:MAG TPA: tail fiber domain-containing protein, partial [Puia sp.]|nr:tail fiber domain-containing protein [Puia sp.]
TSDSRLKTNIHPLPYGLKDVMRMQPVSYKWKDNATMQKIGLIAQEVKKIIPEVVIGDEKKEMLGMNYAELVPVLINAIKEQQQQLEDLKKEMTEMKKEVNKLKKS